MPSQLASLLCVLLIIYLFWIDRKSNDGFSRAVWLPFAWLLYNNSYKILRWLNIDLPGMYVTAGDIEQGRPLDQVVYSFFILAGLYILIKRGIDWPALFKKNIWIWLYFLVGLLSILAWSDYPFISFKRLIKASSTLIMALIIVTEVRPYIAVGTVLKRFAFIVLPLSVLFIKYYPALGRAYHMGEPMFAGVAGHKNGLGVLCLATGIYYSWNLLLGRKGAADSNQHLHFTIYLIMLPMIAWLFHMANSATSLACTIVAILLFAISRHPAVARVPHTIILIVVAGILMFGIMEYAFGLKNAIFELLGRRPDLTNRTIIWEYLLSLAKNPIVGTGYESFWLGERLYLIRQRWESIIQAHNGYLEMYLNMGYVGLTFIACWVVAGVMSVIRHLKIDYSVAVLRLSFISVVVLYNYTEAVFLGANTLWFLFYIGIIASPSYETAVRKGSPC